MTDLAEGAFPIGTGYVRVVAQVERHAIAGAIVAGIATAQPLATAAASTLFGAVGAIALQNNDRIAASWSKLGQDIKNGAAQDAATLVPIYTGIADKVGAAYSRMRPMIRDAFADTGPQMDMLSNSVLNFSSNVMTGLVRTVSGATPVMAGFSSFVESTGRGIRGMFEEMVRGGEAGGTTWRALGSVVEQLLPRVGQLFSVFAQFTSGALPAFTSGLSGGLNLFSALLTVVGPFASQIGTATGYVLTFVGAFKLFGSIGASVDGLGSKLSNLGLQAGVATERMTGSANAGERVATGFNNVGNVLGRVGAALPILGVALVAAGMVWEEYGSKAQENANKALNGSISVQRAIDNEIAQVEKNTLFWFSASQQQQAHAAARDQVLAKIREGQALMGPLELAQSQVALAQQHWNDQVRQYGPTSDQAKRAAEEWRAKQADVEAQTRLAEDATRNYRDRLSELSMGIQGVIGTSLSYEQQLNRLKDGSNRAAEAERDHGRASNEYRDASLNLQMQVDQTARSAQKKAEADNFAKGEAEAARIGSIAYREELLRLANDSDGRVKNAALANIDRLDNTELQAWNAASATSGFHTEIVRLPSGRDVVITTPGLDAARRGITGLSQEIRNINGKDVSIFVTATGKGGIASAGRLATGGPVKGPGTGTSDTAGLFALSNNEHVWTAAEVAAAGGHGAMQIMRKQVLRQGRGMAEGGAVNVRLNTGYKYTGPSPGSIFKGLGEMSFGMGAYNGPVGRGVQQWAGVVLQALRIMGQPASLLATTLRRMNQESGGNPNIGNNWDINARRGTPSMGLMQVIGPTYRAYRHPGYDMGPYRAGVSLNPLSNILASMRYALARYGSLPRAYNRRGGYDEGGLARAAGFMPKYTTEPERVLSPRQTRAFEAAMDGGFGGNSTINVYLKPEDLAQPTVKDFVNMVQKSARQGPRTTVGVR